MSVYLHAMPSQVAIPQAACTELGRPLPFTRLKTHMSELKDMGKFGLSESLEQALPVARKYALLLYGKKKKEGGHPCTNLDELRTISEVGSRTFH